MTYIKQAFTDSLTLDSVKAHLNVTFDDDDDLILGYLKSSLLYVERSTNRVLRPLTYEAEDDELEEFEYDAVSWFCLELPTRPLSVLLDTTEYTSLNDFYIYDSADSLLYIPYDETVTSITANCGSVIDDYSEVELINQARLLLVGNWYAFREADIIGSIKEIPTGVSRIIDILSGPNV